MIHIGSRATGKTRCNKPLARRWWVEDVVVEHGRLGSLGVTRTRVATKGDTSCPACAKRTRRVSP